MLKQLYIKNFTLIDTLDIHFYSGFSVITGETGAGKSIILGAINLLLGQRADIKNIKTGCKKCSIEAHFDLSRYHMEDFFIEKDIDYDPDDCILRRELSITGKSRAFINDTPVSLITIKALGQQLIDIHSQHQNLLLNEEDFQLNVVDIIANNKKLILEYSEEFKSYLEAKKTVAKVKAKIEESKRNEDFLRFQFKELSDANLKENLQNELEQESEKLSHVEEIKSTLFEVDSILNADTNETSVLNKLKNASRSLINITNVFTEANELASRLDSCYIEMKDIAQEVNSYAEDIDFDPQRLENINRQLDKIYTLEQKHHVATVEDLINIKNQIEAQLEHLNNSDTELAELEKEENIRLDKCKEKASQLTKIRQAAAQRVEKEMRERLIPLGIPNVRFHINIQQKPLSCNGCDRVAFLFSANTSTPMQPISQVASGGEIARVMLSLKAMISGAVKLPTIIFDEIDTGVSGKIAEKMADIMQEMGKSKRQVISITHLPQIAAKGSVHYKVYKQETPEGTVSQMIELDTQQRIHEIAQMLSGSEISEAAINNARELLNI